MAIAVPPTGLVGTAAIVSHSFYPAASILCSIAELVLAIVVLVLFRKGI
jgi:hypothetical protein